LREYSASIRPIRATGSCTLKYREKKNKLTATSFPVRLWFENDEKFCLYGDVLFDPKGIGLVINGQDFWAYSKPMEFYIEGKKNNPADAKIGRTIFCPAVIFDFLNPLGNDASLIGSSSIIKCSGNGKIKKVYLERCDKLVGKIEYLDGIGRVSATAKLSDYKKAADANFHFPHKIIYICGKSEKDSDSMDIKFDSVRLWQPNDKQIEALFSRPDTK
jgi:hypothetical protein